MEREVCLRCGGNMHHLGQEQIQLGKYGWMLGSLSNLVSGAMAVDIYCCADCKKLEFYAIEPPETDGEGIAKEPCPYCGQPHEIDDPKCPHCGKRLMDL